MDWNIVKLSKSEYKGTALPNSYKTNEIYGVIKEIDESNNLVLRLFRKKLDEPFIHDAEKEGADEIDDVLECWLIHAADCEEITR